LRRGLASPPCFQKTSNGQAEPDRTGERQAAGAYGEIAFEQLQGLVIPRSGRQPKGWIAISTGSICHLLGGLIRTVFVV